MNMNLRALLLILICLPLLGCEKWWLDRQMEGLCKKDGGIRIYETVLLPNNMFDVNGDPFPGWRMRPYSDRVGPDYELLDNTTVLEDGDPLRGEGLLRRYEMKVRRKADGKVMGEAVVYGRSGGDFIVIDHFSSKMCPERLGVPGQLIKSVFLRERN